MGINRPSMETCHVESKGTCHVESAGPQIERHSAEGAAEWERAGALCNRVGPSSATSNKLNWLEDSA